jgi:hypothetical protein
MEYTCANCHKVVEENEIGFYSGITYCDTCTYSEYDRAKAEADMKEAWALIESVSPLDK